MTTNLTLFIFEDQEIQFVEGKPVANDVARVLGYAQPHSTISKLVSSINKGCAELATPGGVQQVTVLEEAGIYQLIFSSKLPSAERFQQWVFNEVLPSIRKTGNYSVEKKDATDFNLKQFKYTSSILDVVFSNMFEPAMVGQLKINAAIKIDSNLKPLLEESKQLLINATATVDKLCTVTEIAAQLNISAVALNKLLIEKGLQIKVPTTSKTQAKYIPTEQGKSYSKFTQSVDTSGTTFSTLRWSSNVVNLLH